MARSLLLTEVREQPEVLARVRDRGQTRLEGWAQDHGSSRWHLVGCGDMHFAASIAASVGRSWGVRVRAHPSMALRWAREFVRSGDRVVVASVSGRTPRTVEAAGLATAAGARVLALTDNEDSLLTEAVVEHVVLGTSPPDTLAVDAYAGYQHVVPQTKTFLATLYAQLLLMEACAGGEGLEGLPQIVSELTTKLEPLVAERVGSFFEGADSIVVLGSGTHHPIASYGRAKFLEYAIPAVAQCLEEFNHLEIFVCDERVRVVVLGGDDASAQRASELTGPWERLGLQTLVIANGSSFPGTATRVIPIDARDPIQGLFAELVVLQLLAYHGARALGRDVNLWLGGCRTEALQALSQETVRGSRILGA